MFERHYRPVLAYALRRADEADAHDAVADTFLVAWRRRDDVPRSTYEELPWLLGVARRTLANQRRSRERAQRVALRLVPATSDGTSDDDADRSVLEALARLRPIDREVLLLTAWDGLTHRQIAAMFACSENAVAIRLHRSRSRLAHELEDHRAVAQGGDDRCSTPDVLDLIRAVDPVEPRTLPDGRSPEARALAERIVGRSRRRASLLVAAAALVLTAVVIATPAFGIRQAVSDLFGREDIPFQQAPAADYASNRDFTKMVSGAPPGMDPRAITSEIRLAATFAVSGHQRRLWVAPTASGGYCYLWKNLDGGCNNTPRDPSKIALDGSFTMGLNDTVPYMEKLAGAVFDPNAAGVRLTFEDGRQIPLRLVYVSAPIDAGFFAYNPSAQERIEGRRPLRVDLVDPQGKTLATSNIDWVEQDRKAAQLRALRPPINPNSRMGRMLHHHP